MTDSSHRVHGLAGEDTAPDWPALDRSEIDGLLAHYPSVGEVRAIEWHSPRPLSAACLVQAASGALFVKRHHERVRSIALLEEEHRFIAHLRRRGAAIPKVLADRSGHTAVAIGEWVYELHERADGIDRFRDTMSWSPLESLTLARTTGRALAQLHDAARGYDAAQRSTHVLIARSELIVAEDPVTTLRDQLPIRPGLANYLDHRTWQQDLRKLFQPWQAHRRRLAEQPRLWTHGDWHVSNLCWNHADADAEVTAVLDFGLCAANFALFDLAVAIERNAIAWLELDTGMRAARCEVATALIDGYRAQRPLDGDAIALLAGLLPLVHVDFALSEVEYFHAITRSAHAADVAYDTFLLGHAAWFESVPGQALLQAIRDCA